MNASKTDILSLLRQVGHAVAQLRQTLEQLELPGLESAVQEAQAAVDSLNAFPGGLVGVRQSIQALPSPQKEEALRTLDKARLDQDVNAELLKAAMQRNAALQAYAAQASASATYSSEGGVPVSGTGTLLGKF